MKTLLLISLLTATSFAEDWFDADQTRFTMEQAAKTQAQATEQAAQIQAAATDRQTEAIENQTSDVFSARQNSYNLQAAHLMIKAQNRNQCQFKMLVNNRTKKPLYYTDVDGNTAGPIYIKDCGQQASD